MKAFLKALLPTVAAVLVAVGISRADFMYRWSTTAANNSNSDTFTWAEGQAPSTVNDSARGVMAAIAKYRDDTSGKLVTTGTSTAYVLATNSVFSTLAFMDGAGLSFRVNVTSGAAPTLNVDGLGAKALNQATGVAVATGALISGAVYRAVYVNATNEWIVEGVAGRIPSGTTIVAATTCPTGWTTGATHNDKVLRLMTSSPGAAAGTVAFGTVFGRTTTDAFTIAQGNLPAVNYAVTVTGVTAQNNETLDHTHSAGFGSAPSITGGGVGSAQAVSSGTTGASSIGAGIHGHNFTGTGTALSGGLSTPLSAPIDTRVQYVQVVLCTLN